MSFYDSLAQKAGALIEKFGQPCTLTPRGGGTARTTVAARVKQVTSPLGDTGVDIGDWEFLLPGDANPARTERMDLDDGASLIIVHVDAVKPAGSVVVWVAFGRIG